MRQDSVDICNKWLFGHRGHGRDETGPLNLGSKVGDSVSNSTEWWG